MSFNIARAGDRYPIQFVVPKVAGASYTTPKVGDLVVLDTSAANAVKLCPNATAPYGEVFSLNSGNGVLSIMELLPGTYREYPYNSTTPTLGHKVACDANAATHGTALDRSPVIDDNANGTGSVVAVDTDCPHGTGHCVVRFG